MTHPAAVMRWPWHGHLATALALWALAAAHATAADAAATTEAAAQSARTAMRGALMLRDLPLRIHATCKNAGPHPADKTVGDYLAGFLAALQGGAHAMNTVQAACQPLVGGAGAQRCEVWLKHRDTEDEWAWGLRFDMDAAGRQVRQGSVRCLGSG